jgi:pyruvate,water dikinase
VADGAPALSDDQVLELARQAYRVEELFGSPQDVEWTVTGALISTKGPREEGVESAAIGEPLDTGVLDEPVILQSRPITRLAPERFDVEWDTPEQATYTWRHVPWLLRPFEVELADEVDDAMNPGAKRAGLWWFYTDVKQVGPFRFERAKSIEDDEQLRVEYYSYVQALAVEGKNVFTDVYLPKIVDIRDHLDAYESRRASLSDAELIEYVTEALEGAKEIMSYHWLVVQGCLERHDIDRLGEKYDLAPGEVVDLAHGESRLALQRRRVLEMVERVKQSDWLTRLFADRDVDRIVYARLQLHDDGKTLLAAIDSYLAEYGLAELDWNDCRRRKEVSWSAVGQIRAYLSRDLATYVRRHESTLERQRRIEAKLLSRPETREEAGHDIELARKAYLVRDDHAYYIDLTSDGYYRLAAVEVARRLCERGLLTDIDDVDFLCRDELIAAIEGRLAPADLVAARRAEFRRYQAIIPPPFIGKPPEDGQPEGASTAGDAAEIGPAANAVVPSDSFTLTGVSGADIHARGIASTSLGSPGADIPAEMWRELPPAEGEVGTILVNGDVRGIDPFAIPPRVTGLVFGGWGSPFDHIGIVARELGIAAVFDVHGFDRIKDGDTVEILGASGEVRVTPGER